MKSFSYLWEKRGKKREPSVSVNLFEFVLVYFASWFILLMLLPCNYIVPHLLGGCQWLWHCITITHSQLISLCHIIHITHTSFTLIFVDIRSLTHHSLKKGQTVKIKTSNVHFYSRSRAWNFHPQDRSREWSRGRRRCSRARRIPSRAFRHPLPTP